MKIGLLPVDSKFPNLALMKIGAYYKKNGDEVAFYNGIEECDIVYASKIFSFTPDYEYPILAEKVVRGGTGYDYSVRLPEEMESTSPDLSLYDTEHAIGFLTRGCPNNCKWCVVPMKEGNARPADDIEEILQGRKSAILLDNNFLACRKHAIEQLEKIIRIGCKVDFNQGLDARLVDDDYAKLLAKVKWISKARFAADTTPQIEHVINAVALMRKYGYKNDTHVYTIITDDINECYDRISFFRNDRSITPFAQPYRPIGIDNYNPPQWQKDMARWCNRPAFFYSTDFKDFSPRKGFLCIEHFKNNKNNTDPDN